MTKDKTPKPILIASYTQIGNTSYILLPDGCFARKLKPVVVNGVSYYNLSKGKGKPKRITADKIADYLSALDSTTTDKHNTSL